MRVRLLRQQAFAPTVVLAALLNATPTLATPPSVWSKIGNDPSFQDWQAQIARMVAAGDNRTTNHVCVVGWRKKSETDLQQAYVIWPEQHRLITWMPSTEPNSLADETHLLDLKTDVVASEQEIGGSTYLVTRAWVANIERQCHRYGTELLFEKKAR